MQAQIVQIFFLYKPEWLPNAKHYFLLFKKRLNHLSYLLDVHSKSRKTTKCSGNFINTQVAVYGMSSIFSLYYTDIYYERGPLAKTDCSAMAIFVID